MGGDERGKKKLIKLTWKFSHRGDRRRHHFSPLVGDKLRGGGACGAVGAWHPEQIKMQCVELITRFIVVCRGGRGADINFTLSLGEEDKNRI